MSPIIVTVTPSNNQIDNTRLRFLCNERYATLTHLLLMS
jgi:hypothetical protein